MEKKYAVLLGGRRIGYTLFELADPPMGVVMGKLHLEGISSGYDFLHGYCKEAGISTNLDDPEYKCIETQSIDELTAYNQDGIEIKGVGACIGGMDDEGYQIDIFGIPYPFYEREFSHHVQAYDNSFKDNS